MQLKLESLELQIADLKLQQHEEKLVKEQSQMKMYAEQSITAEHDSSIFLTFRNQISQYTRCSISFKEIQERLKYLFLGLFKMLH